MSAGLRERWNQRHAAAEAAPVPARVLVEHAHLLPASGRALDLACGLGANALFMAAHGLDVSAWDLSAVAVERVRETARRRGLKVRPAERDLVREPPLPDTFDVIVVAHFLDRGLAPAIAAALRPGGLLFYQTFIRAAVSERGPSNPAYRLGVNELLRLFDGLIVRAYREEGRVGDLGLGFRDLAWLVAQRPPIGT